MDNKTNKLDDFIANATQNVNADRALASKLLVELMQEMSKSTDKYIHKDFGSTAASYLETLQRSNEQLVKLAGILQRREGVQKGLNQSEKDEIFDIIRGE